MRGILFISLLSVPGLAYAYLDPGSGNALVYLIVSLAGTILYFIKSVFYKVISLIGKDVRINPIEHAEVILFSEGPTYWFTFKPLISELINRKIPFQYLSLDVRDPGLKIDHPLMYSRFMGFGAGAYARVGQCKGKLFLSTTPNIGCDGYPLPRPKAVNKLVHLSHTVGDITYLKKGSLDHYDVNLDIGPWCEKRMREVERNRHLKSKTFHAVGLLYLDELIKDWVPKKNLSNPITVLVAPSWKDKSSLNVHNEHYIEDLLKDGLKVIFRPHPQSFHFEPELINRVINACRIYPNFILDTEQDSRVYMSQADILISDSSSFRFDFAFLTKKPVITLLVPSGNLMSFEAGDLGGPWETNIVPRLGAIVKPGEEVNLPSLVRQLVSKPSLEIEALYNELIVNHGTAAKHIVDWIEQELTAKS